MCAISCLCSRSENWKRRQYNASDPDLLGELSSLFLMMVTATAISMVVAKYEIAFSVFFFSSYFLRRRSDIISDIIVRSVIFRRTSGDVADLFRTVIDLSFLFFSSIFNAPRAIDWSIVSSDTGIFYWAGSFCIYASFHVATRDNWQYEPQPIVLFDFPRKSQRWYLCWKLL